MFHFMTMLLAELPESAVAALRRGNKIEAIKELRQASGLDLRGSKEAVDRYVACHPEFKLSVSPIQAGAGGNAMWIVFGILSAAATVFYLLEG